MDASALLTHFGTFFPKYGGTREVFEMNKKLRISEALGLLSLPSNTNKTAVKKRYRELAKVYHPDQFNNYPEQAASVEEFIAIHAAYELLMSLPSEHITAKNEIEGQRELMKNPERGTYTLPDWIIIEELKNSIYLFRLIYKQTPNYAAVLKWIHVAFSKKSPRNHSAFLLRIWYSGLNWMRWVTFSFGYLTLFVCGFLLMCCIAFCFVFFYPFLFIGKKLNTAAFKAIQKKYGYYPSPTCGNTSGEITYLVFRTFPAVLWCVLTMYVWSELYRIGFRFLFIFLPLGFFAIIILSSILYDWVCFLKVKKWKDEQY